MSAEYHRPVPEWWELACQAMVVKRGLRFAGVVGVILILSSIGAMRENSSGEKRLAVTSVDQLIEAINHYIDRRNDNPTPFVWTASAQSIIAKVSKAKETLATQH